MTINGVPVLTLLGIVVLIALLSVPARKAYKNVIEAIEIEEERERRKRRGPVIVVDWSPPEWIETEGERDLIAGEIDYYASNYVSEYYWQYGKHVEVKQLENGETFRTLAVSRSVDFEKVLNEMKENEWLE